MYREVERTLSKNYIMIVYSMILLLISFIFIRFKYCIRIPQQIISIFSWTCSRRRCRWLWILNSIHTCMCITESTWTIPVAHFYSMHCYICMNQEDHDKLYHCKTKRDTGHNCFASSNSLNVEYTDTKGNHIEKE